MKGVGMLALATASCIIGAILSALIARKCGWTGGFCVLGGAGLLRFGHTVTGAGLVAIGLLLLVAAAIQANGVMVLRE